MNLFWVYVPLRSVQKCKSTRFLTYIPKSKKDQKIATIFTKYTPFDNQLWQNEKAIDADEALDKIKTKLRY